MTVYTPAGQSALVPMTKLEIQIPSISARSAISDNYLYGLQRNPLYVEHIDELEFSSHVQDCVSVLNSFNQIADVNFTILTTILDFKTFFWNFMVDFEEKVSPRQYILQSINVNSSPRKQWFAFVSMCNVDF